MLYSRVTDLRFEISDLQEESDTYKVAMFEHAIDAGNLRDKVKSGLSSQVNQTWAEFSTFEIVTPTEYELATYGNLAENVYLFFGGPGQIIHDSAPIRMDDGSYIPRQTCVQWPGVRAYSLVECWFEDGRLTDKAQLGLSE